MVKDPSSGDLLSCRSRPARRPGRRVPSHHRVDRAPTSAAGCRARTAVRPPASRSARPGFRDVWANAEFRGMFTARLLSRIGDHLAKVAIAILVYDRTGSTALAATTYALTFLPWLVGTPLLSAVGDRFPRRSVLVWCDVIRALLAWVTAAFAIAPEGLAVVAGSAPASQPESGSATGRRPHRS